MNLQNGQIKLIYSNYSWGTGAIIGALKNGKKVIAVPGLAKYGEHVDDHQLRLVEQIKNSNLICECLDCNGIWKAVEMVKTT